MVTWDAPARAVYIDRCIEHMVTWNAPIRTVYIDRCIKGIVIWDAPIMAVLIDVLKAWSSEMLQSGLYW